ncbi:MAG: CCA tRNA nucleotidyltransferase [Candidatus Thermoplasmatota archaeon]
MTVNHEHIEKQVLKKIIPTKKERKELFKTITVLITTINRELKKRKIPATVELVGSTAKDTFLKNNLDIDAFIVFPRSTPREHLEKQGLLIGKKILNKQEECYAEHPYVRGYFRGFKTEIVPCYQIETATQKLSAVDRTPLHTKYIQQHLKEHQKNQVRLLKQFLKGIGCYGAEAEIEGFSGYLCELLILKYGTFYNLIQHAQHWDYGEYLTLTADKTASFDTPLIFIDPIDPTRNVASAVSTEKFNLYKKACIEYLKQPKTTFFFPKPIKPWSKQQIYNTIKNKNYLVLQLEKPKIIPENLYPQIRKALRSITELCERYNFHILDSTFFIDTKSIYLILQPQQEILSETVIHEGPPLQLTHHANDFRKKWQDNPNTIKKPYIQNNKLYVEIKREYITLKQLIHEQLKKQSLGKHIDEIIQKNKFKILNKNNIIKKSLVLQWTRYLSKKNPWE